MALRILTDKEIETVSMKLAVECMEDAFRQHAAGNLIAPGRNYGWPLVANGKHYDGRPIPHHSTRPDLAGPAISWDPVIAPGDFIFYTGDAFPAWKGQVLIAGLVSEGIVRVSIDGESAREEARYPLGARIREIEQAPDGTIWLLEDGKDPDAGRLLKLTPREQ